MEVSSNPLWEIFDKVVHLLNDLRSKKHLMAWQFDKIMPKRERVELAFLYFLPKPHKVSLRFICMIEIIYLISFP